ncbi:hypothetical protein D8X55_05095, partial [Malacoplasma penetrans]
DGNGGGTQTQTITPQLKDSVSLSGPLSDIFDSTGTQNANEKIAADIKDNHLSDVFDNGDALKQVSDLKVTVAGDFKRDSWSGGTYDAASGGWKSDSGDVTISAANKLVYASESPQLNISSLNDLKTQLSVKATLKEALEKAGVSTIADTTTLAVNNNIGLTDDLLHINVSSTPQVASGQTATTTNYDLQIPVSNINLVVNNLTITVAGTNVGEATKTTTNFKFNVGIDATLSFKQTGTAPDVSKTESEAEQATLASTILQKLGYVSSGNTLSDDKISAALGIYNCKFTPKSATENTEVQPDSGITGSNKVYKVTVTATPYDTNYVWDDGTTGPKDISFDVNLKVATS